MATLLNVLTILVAAGPKLPKAWALIQALINLWTEESVLDIYEPTVEEQNLMNQVSENLTILGEQSVLDFSGLRRLIKKVIDSGLGDIFIKLLTVVVK